MNYEFVFKPFTIKFFLPFFFPYKSFHTDKKVYKIELKQYKYMNRILHRNNDN